MLLDLSFIFYWIYLCYNVWGCVKGKTPQNAKPNKIGQYKKASNVIIILFLVYNSKLKFEDELK